MEQMRENLENMQQEQTLAQTPGQAAAGAFEGFGGDRWDRWWSLAAWRRSARPRRRGAFAGVGAEAAASTSAA